MFEVLTRLLGYQVCVTNRPRTIALHFQLLRSNGAILMYKTNVPQTMMTNECPNPIFGITRNPLNLDFPLTPRLLNWLTYKTVS